MWAFLGLFSALFLGVYDLFKKFSLKENAVIPVLFFSTISSAVIFLPLILFSEFGPVSFKSNPLFIPSVDLSTHGLIFVKAMIVVTSWIFAYFAMKHLPITIVTPIRATGPLWTLIGAILIFGEQLSLFQWLGIAVTLCFFYLFSLVGQKEGISFRKNKWIFSIIIGTLIGAASGLYDKFLIRQIDRMAVQAWFSVYQVVVLFPVLMFLWYPRRKNTTPFQWRWAIPFIGVFLVVADFAYFFALSYEDSLISVISALRRGSVIVAFALGAYLLKEKNIQRKGLFLLGILLGIVLILFGSQIK